MGDDDFARFKRDVENAFLSPAQRDARWMGEQIDRLRSALETIQMLAANGLDAFTIGQIKGVAELALAGHWDRSTAGSIKPVSADAEEAQSRHTTPKNALPPEGK